jgi:hypothetical protein
MAMEVETNKQLGLEVYQILREARANEKKERRDTVRYAFFRPVAIHLGQNRLSGFSREISETGIGLLHNADLSPGEVEVVISTEQTYSVHIRTRILWCTRCGDGWYISGGEFVGITRIGV